METVPTKEMCVSEHARIQSYLLVDFEKKLLEHHKLNHTYFIQTSVPNICRDLILDKQLVNYLLLGSTPLRPHWGELREKFDIEPLKYIMRREVVKRGTEQLKDTGFKVYFGDKTGKGDFQMKVDFYPYKKTVTPTAEDSDSDSDSVADKDTKPTKWSKVVKKNRPVQPPRPATQFKSKAPPAPKQESKDEVAELRNELKRLTELVSKLATSSEKKDE
jgi:hypothetical protein